MACKDEHQGTDNMTASGGDVDMTVLASMEDIMGDKFPVLIEKYLRTS